MVAVFLQVGSGRAGGAEDGPGRSRAAWRAVDVTIVAGAVVAALAVARGAVTTQSLAGGTDPLLLALPVITVVCGGLLVGRAWPAVTAALARLLPRRALAPRLGLVGAVRSPLRPVATAAFLAAATGIVAFAGSYQATLAQGAPRPGHLRGAAGRDRPGRTDPAHRRWRSPRCRPTSGPAPTVYPVVRGSATVRLNAAQSLVPQLVGVDPDALALVPNWDDVVGAVRSGRPGPRRAVRADPVRAAGHRAARRHPDARRSRRPGRSATWTCRPASGCPTAATSATPLDPSTAPPAVRRRPRRRPLPAGSVLFAITLTENNFANTRRQHRIGEGGNDAEALVGHVELPTGVGLHRVVGRRRRTVSAGPDRLAVDYQLTGNRVVLRPAGPPPPHRCRSSPTRPPRRPRRRRCSPWPWAATRP